MLCRIFSTLLNALDGLIDFDAWNLLPDVDSKDDTGINWKLVHRTIQHNSFHVVASSSMGVRISWYIVDSQGVLTNESKEWKILTVVMHKNFWPLVKYSAFNQIYFWDLDLIWSRNPLLIAKLSQMDEKPILSCHGLVDTPSMAEHKRLIDDDDSLQFHFVSLKLELKFKWINH